MANDPLGEAIKRVRMGSGLTQREAADRLGIDATYLSHLEAGRKLPSLDTLRGIARLPGVPSELVAELAVAAIAAPRGRVTVRRANGEIETR